MLDIDAQQKREVPFMFQKSFFFVVILLLQACFTLNLSPHSSFAQTSMKMEMVRVGMPSFSLSFLAPGVAKAKGFFQEESLEVELIRIRTSVAMIALTNGEIDYTTAVGGGLRSAVKGLPVKVVIYFNRKPLHVLVAKSEIRSIQDLKGKVVSFAGFGDSTEYMLRSMLERAHMSMDEDVKLFPVAGSGNRIAALLSRKVDAAVLPPPYNLQAEAKGFRRLMRAADVFEISTGGLVAHTDKLRDNPTQIKRMIRALLKSQNFIRDHKAETVKIISDWLSLDRAIAEGSYDLYVSGMSQNGLVREQVIKAEIDRYREDFNIKEALPIGKVADFSILRKGLAELNMMPSNP
jgi:NitT/TauT family transport system substrate-binding protein